jgi:hypothetical protein
LGFATIGNVAFVALEERHARLDAPYAAGVVDIGACGLSSNRSRRAER